MAEEEDFELFDSEDEDYEYESDGSDEDVGETLLTECESFTAASKYVDTFSPFDFRVRHNISREEYKRQVRECVSHEACPYLVSITQSSGRTLVHEYGRHGEIDAPDTRRGVNKRVIDEVDAILLAGAGPKKCLKILQEKYKDSSTVLKILPDATQLKNRKQALKSSTADPTTNTLAYLQQWATRNTCPNARAFFGGTTQFNHDTDLESFQAQEKAFKDQLLVLSCFPHNVETPNGNVLSFGVIVTSRRLLRNAVYAAEGQAGQLLAAADGTYKVHSGGWTLASVGSYGVVNERNKTSRRYYPWGYVFVRAESTEAYTQFFTVLRDRVLEYFGVDLDVKFGSLDHADMILNAFRAVWPTIQLLSCWPHLSRNARKKAVELGCLEYYNSVLKVNLKYLHEARSTSQFEALSVLMLASWTEEDFSEWLRDQYLHENWCCWFATSSAVAGILPNQNPVEAHHRALKACAIDALRASTAHVLNGTLPNVVGFGRGPLVQRHFTESHVPIKVSVHAMLLKNRQNHRLVYQPNSQGKVVKAVLFNAREYVVDGVNTNGLVVDATRARRYLKSVNGVLDGDDALPEIHIKYLSLHQVLVLNSRPVTHTIKTPRWSVAEIEEVRAKYRCDCKAHMISGWYCSHVVTALALLDKLDLTKLLRDAPPRMPPGRPKAVPRALEVDRNATGVFNKDRLMTRLLKSHAYCLNWKVVKEFERDRDGAIETIPGVVTTYINREGIVYWKVKFSNGRVVELDCEEMATVIVYSHATGYSMR